MNLHKFPNLVILLGSFILLYRNCARSPFLILVVFKYKPFPASFWFIFVLIAFQHQIQFKFQRYKWKKHRCCAWESNPWPQIVWEVKTTELSSVFISLTISWAFQTHIQLYNPYHREMLRQYTTSLPYLFMGRWSGRMTKCVTVSVTRLGNFFKFLVTSFLSNVAQILGDFLGYFVKDHLFIKRIFGSFLGLVWGGNSATFLSNYCSHWWQWQ